MKWPCLTIFITLIFSSTAYGQFQPATSIFAGTGIKPGRVREPSPKTTLDDFFPRTDIPQVSLPPISLKAAIPGLPSAAMDKLATNYFVVVNDARVFDFAQVYRQNHVDGQANFVTVDAIIHPLLAHQNAIRATVITKTCTHELLSMLQGMITQSVADYREAEEAEVKDDILRNLAYLSVAVRLLEPSFKLKEFGGAQDLIDQELNNLDKGDLAQSAIFKRDENFALYRPFGFYQSSDTLKNFFRCRQWLARMSFSLSDVTNNTTTGSGNEFRRATLLYRSLSRTKVSGTNGLTLWRRLNQILTILENNDARLDAGDLLPENFAHVVPPDDTNLKVTIEALSQPLARTRLLLSLKSAENKELSSTSIFELNTKDQKAEKSCVFRLFRPFDPPEFDWLGAQIIQEKDATTGFSAWPVGLLFLHARASRLANNILADNTWRLDEDLVYSLPTLDRSVALASQSPSGQSLWPTLINYLRPLPDGAQNPLRTNVWMSRCLESALASWLDDWLALEKPPSPSDAQERSSSTKDAPHAVRKISYFNYLEPVPEVFHKLANGLRQFDASLEELSGLPPELKKRSEDFIRLTDRFCEIAKQELTNQPLAREDAQLLSNIDRVLDQISSPVAGSIFLTYGKLPKTKTSNLPSTNDRKSPEHHVPIPGQLAASQSASKPSRFMGTNLGLGGPGTLWIILRGPKGPILCRGAVYSFYETPGDAITPAHWQRRLDYGLLKPPFWCDPFQLVDQTTTKH
jgi:hypothetical protein